MNKKIILIIVAVIAALALLITGTVLLLRTFFVSKVNDNSSNQNPVTSSDVSGNNGSTDSSGSKNNTSNGNGSSNSGKADSDSKSESESSATSSGNTTTFTVGNVSGKKGDKISVPVELSSNQGFMGCIAKFKYDTSSLKYTGYKRSSLLKDYEVHEENGTIKFMTLEDKDVTANGTILYLEFEITSAKAQKSAIEIAIDKTGIANYDEQYVPVKTVNGSVEIK